VPTGEADGSRVAIPVSLCKIGAVTEHAAMPRFSANLGHLFPEYPLIERIGAAA